MKEKLKTGYPHKDKMWLKYYDSEFLKRKNPSTGIYDYMKEKTRNILNNKLKYISSIVSEIESPELIVIKKEQYRCLNTAFKALSSKHKLLIKCYILKIIPPNTVIKYTHLKYSDRMIELQIAINVLRRYYLFLYEKG